MVVGSEQFMVVAFAERHKRNAVPDLRMPSHILLASFTDAYRLQATTRISDMVRGNREIKASVAGLMPTGGDTAWKLKRSKPLVRLQRQILNAALLNNETELTDTGSKQPHRLYLTGHEGELRAPGDVISITELSVVGWIGAGLVVYRNIPLELMHETTA